MLARAGGAGAYYRCVLLPWRVVSGRGLPLVGPALPVYMYTYSPLLLTVVCVCQGLCCLLAPLPSRPAQTWIPGTI